MRANDSNSLGHRDKIIEAASAVIRDLREKYAAARREIEILKSQNERDYDDKTLLGEQYDQKS